MDGAIAYDGGMLIRPVAAGALLLFVLWGCAAPEQRPERPEACDRGEVAVFAGIDWYDHQEADEQTVAGRFVFHPPRDMAGGRYRAYSCGDRAVYGGGPETTELMQAWDDLDVVIRGKIVDLGFGPELWPATIACAD